MDEAEAIRAAGLRVTRQRVAVLAAVARRPHASAAAVLDDVGAVLPDVSHQAVYDGLAQLAAAGLLRRMVVDGGPMLFETRTRDNHHHFICRACDAVFDVDCAVGAAPCLQAAGVPGFVVDEAEVLYRGFCPACAAQSSHSTPIQSGESPWQK